MKELRLVLLCVGPRESPSHPLHWILPYRLVTVHLRENTEILFRIAWRSKTANLLPVALTVYFTLMPSLAPSCRYGMMEWFHRSMNHCLNSATDTGQDRKKQGPTWKAKFQVNRFHAADQIMFLDCVSTVSHLWGSLRCCASPGKCGGGTRAEGPSPVREGEPGGVLGPAPSPGRLPQLYDAGIALGTH